jgi:hypothetical protein
MGQTVYMGVPTVVESAADTTPFAAPVRDRPPQPLHLALPASRIDHTATATALPRRPPEMSAPAVRPPSAARTPTDVANPQYYHKVVDCQWACPAHTNVPEYIRLIAQ